MKCALRVWNKKKKESKMCTRTPMNQKYAGKLAEIIESTRYSKQFKYPRDKFRVQCQRQWGGVCRRFIKNKNSDVSCRSRIARNVRRKQNYVPAPYTNSMCTRIIVAPRNELCTVHLFEFILFYACSSRITYCNKTLKNVNQTYRKF